MKERIKNKKFNLDFLLLLTYSLAPGFAKILDLQYLMLMNIPVLLYFLLTSKVKILKKDILFIYWCCFVVIQTIIVFFKFPINRLGLFMGLYMVIIPMYGYCLAKDKNRNIQDIVKIFQKICFVHFIIGIILYPLFPFYKAFPFLFEQLNENVMAGRMASVSGSLGFAIMMSIGLNTTIYRIHIAKEKNFTQLFFLVCYILGIFLSLQRSSWLGLLINVMYLMYFEVKRGKIKFLINSIIIIIIFTIGISKFSNEFIISRIKSFDTSAANERSNMWIGGLENFKKFPSGIGVGQVGQVGRFAENINVNGVPDGDYFRIMSEFGLIGIICFSIFLTVNYSTMIFIKNKSILILITMVLNSFFISMIGSNSTEFYYVNFIFWYFLGLLFEKINIGDNINENRGSITKL